ncbi:hypothetical protein BH18ACT13_BH18ACT13_00090 [soil metagenome]
MRHWALIAHVYDWQLVLERPALNAALDLLDPTESERLLDVATGTGAVLRELARRTRRPAEAVGVDLSSQMLARAAPVPTDWKLVQGDVAALPFSDATFDVAAAAYVLHILDDSTLARALAEIRRVLVPHGRLVTVTPAAPRSPLRRPYLATVGALARVAPSALGLRPLDPSAALRRAGFEPVRRQYVASGYPSLCILARVAT